MSTLKELRELTKITEMIFARNMSEMQRLSQSENQLRARFEKLKQQQSDAQTPTTNLLSQQLTGLDVLYQVWVGRQMASVNAELAKVLVEKEARLEDLKSSFGKREVAVELQRRQCSIKRPVGQDW
jgi:cell division protein FtsB